jgi:peptide/nickel transport system permease protein
VVSIVPPSVFSLTAVLGLLFGIGGSRVIRSAVLQTARLPYVEAARALGAGPGRIIVRHILPNVAHVVIIAGSLLVGQVIIIEATVSFLGFGLPPPAASWGRMLGGSSRTFMSEAPWMALAPGVALSLTVLAFNMLGDALRDELDPKLSRSA